VYDADGNLSKAIDIEGNGFNYSYDADIRVTSLESAQGRWDFVHEPAYAYPYNTLLYGQRVRITDPLGNEQYYEWSGFHPSHGLHMDARGNATQWMPAPLSGQNRVMRTVHPDGTAEDYTYDAATGKPASVTDARGFTTHFTYNAQGQTTSVTDAKGQTTTYIYEANGVDLREVRDAGNRVVARLTYDNYHQPIAVTLDPNGRDETTSIGYTAWGALEDVTDPQGDLTSYNYDATSRRLLNVTRSNGGTPVTLAAYTYNTRGQVTSATDASGLSLAYEYNDLGYVSKITYPDGTYEQRDDVCCGMPGAVRDRAGKLTYYDYDPMKRLARVQDSAGHTLQLEYDEVGNLSALLDSKGSVTSWRYDSRDRPVQKTYSGGGYEAWSYDAAGHLSAARDARGQTTGYAYDPNDNLVLVDYPYSADVSLIYDQYDNLQQMNDGLGATVFTYDVLGRLLSENGPWSGDTVSYDYDSSGRRDWMKINATDQTSYGYDVLERLSSLTSPAGTFNYSYAGNSDRLDTLTRPSGAYSHFSYDSLERLTSLSNRKGDGTLLNKFSYGFDATGTPQRDIRTSVDRETPAGTVRTSFTYDDVNQLTRELSNEPAPVLDKAYSYDAMGNRTQRLDHGGSGAGGSTSNYTHNPLNQLTGVSYTDATGTTDSWSGYWGGFLVSSGVSGVTTASYTYHDDGSLNTHTRRDASGVNVAESRFVYDGFGRKRIAKEYSWKGGAWVKTGEVRFVYDGLDVVQERDASNAVTATLTRNGNIGGILARAKSDGTFYYHYDGSGNVVQLTDASQNVVAEYSYDAFGNTLSSSGTQAGANPWQYSTKYHHADGLYDDGFRFYSPGLGRWINRDPLAESGGLNLYGFVANSPTNFVDTNGLYAQMTTFDGAQGYGATRYSLMGGGGGSGIGPINALTGLGDRMQGVDPFPEAGGLMGGGLGGIIVKPRGGTKPISGFRPPPGTRVRPSNVPSDWKIKPSLKPGGVRYIDPKDPGNSVRVMPGNPNSPWPHSQQPYVRWNRNGCPLDVNGNPLPTDKMPAAHIPLADFQYKP
jgi:RHS repeat-associated protein